MKEIVDFIMGELVCAGQIALVAIGVGGAFIAYAMYFGG